MARSLGEAGFEDRPVPIASNRLIDVVAASLVIGSLSLCLIVTITVFWIKVGMAMPVQDMISKTGNQFPHAIMRAHKDRRRF